MRIEERIIYEDNHLIAINKMTGELSQGDKTGDATVIDVTKAYLKEKYNKPGAVFLHPVHRLDRPTSGILLLAKTTKALSRMTLIFKNRKVIKTYLAFVKGSLTNPNGELVHYLLKNKAKNHVKISKPGVKGAQKAILHYSVIWTDKIYSCLEIIPFTGRSHQIRVQLSQIGHPIIGDVKYACDIPYVNGGIALHSYSLQFIHPVRKTELFLKAEFPTNKIWRSIAGTFL